MVPKEVAPSQVAATRKTEKMTLEITCPNCHFTKILSKEKIPDGVKWATCPRCEHRFNVSFPEPPVISRTGAENGGSGYKTGRNGSPWEKRSEIGLWQGIVQTSKAVLFSPDKFFGKLSPRNGMKEPLAFGLLLGSIGTMFGFFWQFLIMSGSLLSSGIAGLGQIAASLIFLAIIVISPLFVLISILFTSAILHGLLLLVRAGNSGFQGTFRVVSYAQAAQIFGVIPLIGGLIGSIWLLIVQMVGLREIHQTSYLRLFMALLIPLALILLVIVAVVIPLILFA
jgi:hypothetical protein